MIQRTMLFPLLAVIAALIVVVPARADTNADVVRGLAQGDVYVTNAAVPQAQLHSGDKARLEAQTQQAASQGVTEKIAIVSHIPRNYHTAAQATAGLRTYMNFSGVLIVVSPVGIALSSDSLTSSQMTNIARRARPVCIAGGYTACALLAARQAVTQARADKNSSFHDAAVFWFVLLIVLALIVLVLTLALRRRRKEQSSDLGGLRQAGYNTLALADADVQEIESRANQLNPDARTAYDRALALRQRAREEIERGGSKPQLTQANEDAAQAVLALQGVMRQAGIAAPTESAMDLPEHRCFYCGRTNRPPYIARAIDDGKGNSLQVEICTVDAAQLQRGQTPQVATVQGPGGPMPWWAINSSPWYYAYGGPSWQYWLPFMIGMDVGSWYGGGWGMGPMYYGGGDDGWVGNDQPGYGDTNQTPSDAGGADFGGWGDQGASTGGDSGGWGGDVGGGGADFGGGDFGGGDSGGGDSGGWG